MFADMDHTADIQLHACKENGSVRLTACFSFVSFLMVNGWICFHRGHYSGECLGKCGIGNVQLHDPARQLYVHNRGSD